MATIQDSPMIKHQKYVGTTVLWSSLCRVCFELEAYAGCKVSIIGFYNSTQQKYAFRSFMSISPYVSMKADSQSIPFHLSRCCDLKQEGCHSFFHRLVARLHSYHCWSSHTPRASYKLLLFGLDWHILCDCRLVYLLHV